MSQVTAGLTGQRPLQRIGRHACLHRRQTESLIEIFFMQTRAMARALEKEMMRFF